MACFGETGIHPGIFAHLATSSTNPTSPTSPTSFSKTTITTPIKAIKSNTIIKTEEIQPHEKPNENKQLELSKSPLKSSSKRTDSRQNYVIKRRKLDKQDQEQKPEPIKRTRRRLQSTKEPKQRSQPVINPKQKSLSPKEEKKPSPKNHKDVTKSQKYNLRSLLERKKTDKHKRVVFAANTKFVSKKAKHSFGDLILSNIDTNTYHSSASFEENSDTKKILELTNKTTVSQLDKFVHNKKSFIIMSWLTTARIFEYDNEIEQYSEVKRIPERYVNISPNIITSVHYNASKFYLAYLWSPTNEKPFIEIRDIYGKLLHNPIYYDQAIDSIYSDSNYVYAKTCVDSVYIHDKRLFNCSYYCVDFSRMISGHLIATWIEPNKTIKTKLNTKFTLLSATTREILVTLYDIFSHSVIQCYRFDDNYKIVSISKADQLIIVHRNSNNDKELCKTKIDFGFMGRTQQESNDLFIHEATLEFESDILEIKVNGDNLYLYGYNSTENYEVGCIYLPNLRPLWVTSIKNTSASAHIIPHDDNIAIINESQKLTSIKTIKENCLNNKRVNILTNMSIHRNCYLYELGASIFKKFPLHVD